MGNSSTRPKRFLLTGGVVGSNGVMNKMTMTVDTAADISIMSRKMMNNLGLHSTTSPEIKLHGFQG